MGEIIPVGILEYAGQVIKDVRQNEATGELAPGCWRGSRHRQHIAFKWHDNGYRMERETWMTRDAE